MRRGAHRVHDIMKHRRPVVAGPEETAQAAAARMTEEACGSVLVCDGDRLRGIFTERDLMTRVVSRGLDPRTTRLEQVMTRDPDRIESTATACEALWRMDEFGYRHLPVMKDGHVLGVVSMRDLPIETVAEVLPELEWRRVLAERMR
jgi:CBS domain-containing protein